MKFVALLLPVLSASFVTSAAFAVPPGVPPGGIRPPTREETDPKDPWPDHGRPSRGGGGHTSCAPEVVQGNVAATERALRQLTQTTEFSTANEFRARLSSISLIGDNDAKVSGYLSLIGIDSQDSPAVAEFIGARDVRGAWLTSLEKSTGLSDSQAETVARSLQTALRGNLQ